VSSSRSRLLWSCSQPDGEWTYAREPGRLERTRMSDVLGLDHAVQAWIAESDQRVRFGLGPLGWRAGGELP
jgi:hypothetical protein